MAICGDLMGCNENLPQLAMTFTGLAMENRWPIIEIDGLANLKMVDLSMAMLNNQMVILGEFWMNMDEYSLR